MNTTHAIIRAVIDSRKAMRDAYVDLQGVECTLRVIDTVASNRRNVYGEINAQPVLAAPVAVSIVMDLGKYLQVVDSKSDVSTDERDVETLEGIVKLTQIIKIGDRVTVPFSHFFPSVEDKVFQVSNSRIVHHVGELSKKISLVPLRDN